FYGTLDNHDLAVTFAEAWKTFAESIGAPTTLLELPDFTSEHIDRMLKAAKDPQLAMKLANMPVPMKTEEVDIYMKPVLEAAVTGDFDRIVTH
ncbi:MAG: iron-containing alcohol dehydrogenase, partial [Firmicutes bacterium]|nr:iron-containing alcohol dehydrogenase [Bacillota bacterium]